jgi:Outer membrane protein and related peptidoglycan-associated (lipo)proteins
MRMIHPIAVLLPLALAACAGQTQTQGASRPAASPFSQALAGEYTRFADSEYVQSDWPDTATMRAKANMAAQGRIPAPEDPTRRGVGTGLQLHPDIDIGKEQRGEAIQGRQRLIGALSGQAPQTNPQAAARAQVAYDCWVEQLEEGWQRDDIERCRTAFNTAMAELEARPVPVAAAPAPRPTEERLQVYFAFDSSRLDERNRQAVAQVARDVTSGSIGQVSVDGHADRAGPDDYNRRLSERRAQTVREELLAQGVPAERIQTSASGETAPAVPTPDGVPQPENRRTVIEFD